MADQRTPGIKLRPWNQPWQVCFVPCWQHWTMKPFRMPPPFQHVFLLRPFEYLDASQSRWIYTEWSFMGCVIRLLDTAETAPLHRWVMNDGAMLFYNGSRQLPPPRMGNGLWPLTCVTYVRQVLGLPFSVRTWTPLTLWRELLERDARVVVSPPQDRLEGRQLCPT